MHVIGLTGGIASGKSTISSHFKSIDIPVIDADIIAKQIVNPTTIPYKKIVKLFGKDILQPDNQINRKKLGSLIFNDPILRTRLNEIVHPAIQLEMLMQVILAFISLESILVMDIPLLFEKNLNKYMSSVWVVYCGRDEQIERLMKRESITREDSLKRIDAQMDLEFKKGKADYVVNNTGEPDRVRERVMLEIGKCHRLRTFVCYFWWTLGSIPACLVYGILGFFKMFVV